MRDHHVDRPEVEAGQPAQLTGTNRSIGFSAAPSGKNHDRWHGSAIEATGEASASPRAQGGSPPRQETRTQFASGHEIPGSCPGISFAQRLAALAGASGGLGRPGGHSEGQNTRSHPELGRENPQRRWYCVLRRGRVGRRQARQNRRATPNPRNWRRDSSIPDPYRGVEQPGSSSGS